MNLGYLIMRLPFGVTYTLDQAYPFVQNAVIAIGFPDIIFQPDDTFKRLLARLATSNADVVLGVVPFENPQKGGMVDFDTEGRVRLVVEKPDYSDLRYSWCTAVWTPVFTEFMHQYVAALETDRLRSDAGSNLVPQRELPIGDVIQLAIENGLSVQAEVFTDGAFLDIGTPEDLVRAVRHFAAVET